MYETNVGRPRSGNRPRGERGFSMAEVLVAVALLSVILLALFGLVTAGMQRAYGGKKMTQAATIAQEAMERANVYAPHLNLVTTANAGTYTTLQTMNVQWSKTGSSITPAAPSGTAEADLQQIAWRNLLVNSDLPSPTGKPAKLTITAKALPDGQTFANATFVRMTVDLEWYEYGTRRRVVHLQSINLPEVP